MSEFLGIMLAVIFQLTPQDVNRVQVWPDAGNTNQQTRELSLTFRRTETGWCPDFGDTNQIRCMKISDGKWLDEQGKTLLEVKDNLKVSNGTNYVFKPKDWENPLNFSIAEEKEERSFEIKNEGKVVRIFKVKTLK